MKLLRKLFHILTLRERFLFSLIVWALLLAWVLGLLEGFQERWNTYTLNRQLIASFEATLEQESAAAALLENARRGLDGAKTFTSAQLGGRLDSIARENDISSFDISSPSTVDTDLFSFHTVRLSIKRGQITDLIRFDLAVKEHTPYIALSDFQLTANKRDPRFLDAVFELVSFELKEDALND
jgi:hypothetical protein